MKRKHLYAISPIDGRYSKHTRDLGNYFSEAALIKYRVLVEVEYFIALYKIPLPQLKKLNKSIFEKLLNIKNITEEDILRIKNIENTTNHDVKAVEYFLRERFDEMELQDYKEFIHFGLTSQDINNTAFPMMIRDAQKEILIPVLNQIIQKLDKMAIDWKSIPMLARTHGQPASPTLLGKEIKVFAERLQKQLETLLLIPFTAKFGGATGNFNAHHVAYPNISWINFADEFCEKTLGLKRQSNTTQIEHYDFIAANFDNLKRINNILIDLNRDLWSYISMDYFKQKIKEGEVGSSAMPHKVNPIDFENSEGNLGIANAIFEHLSAKLPISRLQRDLTDSTVIRNIGVPLAHTLIAFKSLLRGLDKIFVNEQKIQQDLDDNWAVVAEAIQTILRRENFPNPFEALKELTRKNEKITSKSLMKFIESINVSDEIKEELKRISPFNYTGISNF